MLKIGDHEIESRLVLGTGKYAHLSVMRQALAESGTGLVTVAVRRVDLSAPPGEGVLGHLERERYLLLPNTAGCFTAEDAILTAQLGREALGTNLVKLEVIGHQESLWPDNTATVAAAKTLVAEGFAVLPYCGPDPVVAQQLIDAGCVAVMPLAAPIGSGLGIQDAESLAIVRRAVSGVPLIVDAGVGTASDAAVAMELGCDGVLMNTAVAEAQDPIKMAAAMRAGVAAGRLAYEAGRMPRRGHASPSSPTEGVPGS